MKKKLIMMVLCALFSTTILVNNVSAENIRMVESIANKAPGPIKPIDTIVLDDFSTENGWEVSGADITYTEDGAIVELTSNNASIKKNFSYNTWEYSDLFVKIKDISENATWSLSVQGKEVKDNIIIIQKPSSNANSKFGESFIYSLEGLAGAQNLSNWNDESVKDKEFTLIYNFTANSGDYIELGKLERSKPNYEIPEALPSNVTGVVGGVNFDGDSALDVDTIRNDDNGSSTSSYIKEHMWMSLPYSRLVVNPGYEFDNEKVTPVDKDLDLRFGVYYGIKGNANKTGGVKESKSGFQGSSLNSILTIDNQSIDENSITSAWYPHKLERSASVLGKGNIFVTDFMINKETIGRIIDLNEFNGENLNITVKDSTTSTSLGMTSNNLKSQWDNENGVVIKTDNLDQSGIWNENLFYQAMKVVALNDDGSVNAKNTELISTPEFISGKGEYNVPASIDKVGIVIGYSTREEGKEVAINRALEGSGNNIIESYNYTKDYWNDLLREVPVPAEWGIEDENILNENIVTEDKHKTLYYAGWVHNFINTIEPTPETGYAYTQQALGKPSRQVGGANMTPANNCWEGVLQIQNIMYVDPSAAWSGMEGFMAMVDANGYLDGEVLPVRMAQTFWMVHSVSPDKERLKEAYPALKRHLEYKISEPRWIYGNEKTQNEIDQEYITSWLNDVVYMIEICKELGGEYTQDVDYWEKEYDIALSNYADWFFADPMSHEAIGSYPQDGTGPKTLRNGAELPDANYQRGIWTRIFQIDGDVTAIKDSCTSNTDEGNKYAHSNRGEHIISPAPARYPREWLQVILSGLVINDIPMEQARQLEQLMLDINNPALPLAGIENCKWAPNSFLVYGLINRGFYDEAKNQLDSYLVKSIEVWEFCENYFYNKKGPKGTAPTSFGASQIIELTIMKNGVINDGFGVREIPNWNEGMNKPTNPEITVYSENEIENLDFNNINLPKEVKQVYNRVNYNGEEYTLNKIASVKWDKDSLVSTDTPNVYQITGKTETHDTIVAKIVGKVNKDELINIVEDAKRLIEDIVVGNEDGQYPEEALNIFEAVITEIEDKLANELTNEEIYSAMNKLNLAINEFKESVIIKEKIEVTLSEYKDTIKEGQMAKFEVNIDNKATGTIKIYNGEEEIGEINVGDKLFTKDLEVGTHIIKAVYSGDLIYAKTESNIIAITVEPKK